MATCTGCGSRIGFLDKISINDTVLKAPIFKNATSNTQIPHGGTMCEICASKAVVAFVRKLGVTCCSSCKSSIEECSVPWESRDLGKWRLVTGSKLEFDCVGCASSTRIATTPKPEEYFKSFHVDEVDSPHPWQDYIDDDPHFWERLKD
jgi:hypothetical protein